MAFARVGGNFYIHGGATYADNLIPQFWGLDLTKSWTTSNPVWNSFKPGPYNAFHSAGYSSDNSTFITFGRDSGAAADIMPASWLNVYDIKTDSWTQSNPSGLAENTRRDFYAATNPSSNEIYVLGGNSGPAGNTVTNVFDTYRPTPKTLTETTVPTGGPTNYYTYASNWSMVNSDWDGSRVAVFGGYPVGSQVTGDPNAYILDTTTWTWTAVPYSGKGRGYSACTIVGDTFIVWGGHYDNPSKQGGVPTGAESLLLLSLSTRTWGTSYTPPADLANYSGPSGGTTNGGSTSGNGTGSSKGGFPTAAIGGIAAAVVVLLLVAGFVMYRRNKRKNNNSTAKSNKNDFAFSKEEEARHGDAQGSLDGPPPRRPPPPPEDLSPALYDFESSPSPQGQHKQRLSATSAAYAPHNSYQNPSPEMVEAHHPRPSMEGYSSHAGYSNYSTPTNPPLAVHPEGYEPQEYSPYPPHHQQPRAYSTDYSYGNGTTVAGSVYYPPPPPTLSPPPNASRSPPGAISGYLRDENTSYPYKVPAPEQEEVLHVDQYHDAYGNGMKDTASYTSDFSTRGRRPLSGPQGGPGYGSVYEPSIPGAPQSIPE
ncbi:hypothetical protein BGX31_007573 [Mortierella sp. GBA43]|nr:hypothetical protein BGX31_007573 [Mortierella sp. GBA43]